MKTTITAVAAVMAAAFMQAAPAAANEGRAEVRGGIVWAGGEEEALAGVAAGYDFDLGSSTFFGVEGSADKALVDGADVVWGLSGRFGAKVGAAGKLYGLAGYTFGEGEDQPHLGGGYQHKLGESVYVKAEYRHYFSDFVDSNTATVGVGVAF